MQFKNVSRDVRWLSLGFLLLFFGFNGVQQYITIYFKNIGHSQVGFVSLILVYAAFMGANILSPVIISHIGARKTILAVYGVYALYCLALLSGSIILIYILSLILGCAAALLWTGQNSYLIRASAKTVYGENAGFFGTLFAIGSAFGILLMGFILPKLGYNMAFILFVAVIVTSLICFLKMSDIRSDQQPKGLTWEAFRSSTAIRFSMLWLAFNFIQGLVLGTVPLKIQSVISISAVGPLIAIFYIMPMLFSYLTGKKSDMTGRRIWIYLMLILSVIGLFLIMFGTKPLILIIGVVVLACNFGISRTIAFALVGDVTDEKNTEAFSALVWAIQAGSTLLALVLSTLLRDNNLYIVGIIIVVITILPVLPLLRLPLEVIRNRITKETIKS
ncbi:MAG: MFS transporter [Patescibacteria group bacterium]|jgi:MFS family permease